MSLLDNLWYIIQNKVDFIIYYFIILLTTLMCTFWIERAIYLQEK